MADQLYEIDPRLLYPSTIVLIMITAEFGGWLGRRHHQSGASAGEIGTLTGAALGLLALLLGFSFSLALSRYDTRRTMVLEEANAIGSTANFVLMLPVQAQTPILSLLRDYTAVRIGLGVPYDPTKLQRDVATSIDLQNKLWQQAIAATAAAPQSLPAYRLVASLNEVNNIHERRLTALRYHVPGAVMFMLVGVAMVGIGFTGYHAGVSGTRGRIATLIMAVNVAVVIVLIVDLDQPARGLIRVPAQPLVDAAQGIPQ